MNVQARQLNPAFGGFGLGLELFHELVQHLLQRPEVQAQGVWRQAEQGVGGGETHALFGVIQHRAEQQRALAGGHQADDAVDGGLAHQRRFAAEVLVRELQGLGAGVVGQFGMQGGAALG